MKDASRPNEDLPDLVAYDERLREGARDSAFESERGEVAETIRLLRNVLGGLDSGTGSVTQTFRSDATEQDRDFADSSPQEPPDILPDRFEFIEVVGRGAFGVVWRAFDCELKGTVAIKVPFDGLTANSDLQLRFLRESRAVARLNHPSIVRVLDAGRDGLRTWFVSEFVEGPSLTCHLDSQSMSIREAVKIARDLADAVHHAHVHGVLHRDIKPDNILIDQAESDADTPGLPRLTDFGLARIADEDQQLSRSGTLIGTPRYMAPEQLVGDTSGHSVATDIYALGVVL